MNIEPLFEILYSSRRMKKLQAFSLTKITVQLAQKIDLFATWQRLDSLLKRFKAL